MRNETVEKVHHPKKLPQFLLIGRRWKVNDGFDALGERRNAMGADMMAQK